VAEVVYSDVRLPIWDDWRFLANSAPEAAIAAIEVIRDGIEILGDIP